MLKNKRRVARSLGLLAVFALFAALLTGGAAQAGEGGTKDVARSGAAGLSTADAGAPNADAEPPNGAAANSPGVRLVQERARFAYECPTSAVACYYSGLSGTGLVTAQYGCGFAGLGGTSVYDNVHSLKNQSSGPASLYNWTGHGYQLVGWVFGGKTGNFHDNVGADVTNVFC